MIAGPAGAAAPRSGRTHHRTLGTRLLAAACAAVFLGAAFSVGARSGGTPSFFVLAGIALLSLANLATAWGDRVILDDRGIEIRNVILARLGQRPQRADWDDVVSVREHRRPRSGGAAGRPSAVMLTLRSGRRMVLDAIEGYDDARMVVRSVLRPGPDGAVVRRADEDAGHGAGLE